MRIVTGIIILIGLIGNALTVCAEEPAVTARLLVSNPSPYLGEEIDLLLEVTYNRHPGGRTRFSWPSLDSFISADLTDTRSQRSRDGENRLVETVARRIRPLKSGTIILPQSNVTIGRQNIPIQPLTLRVKPLPVMGKPDPFGDQIGTYRLRLEASGTGPRVITLHIFDSNQLAALPNVSSWPEIGRQLIPLETETRDVKGEGQEHILHYYYIPDETKTDELRFSLPTFEPQQQGYLEIATGPAPDNIPWAFPPLLLLGLPLILASWLLLRLKRHPRTITGCLEKLCQRPVDGLSRESIQRLLNQYLDPNGQEALQRFWQDKDALRFSTEASTDVIGPRITAESLRRHLWKGIDKQRDNP